MLADSRLSPFFDGLDVERIKRRQKDFLSMAFGGPHHYDGPGLRAAHRHAVANGLNEPVYVVFMGHFRATLEELGLPAANIRRIMDIAESGRDEVLNR